MFSLISHWSVKQRLQNHRCLILRIISIYLQQHTSRVLFCECTIARFLSTTPKKKSTMQKVFVPQIVEVNPSMKAYERNRCFTPETFRLMFSQTSSGRATEVNYCCQTPNGEQVLDSISFSAAVLCRAPIYMQTYLAARDYRISSSVKVSS